MQSPLPGPVLETLAADLACQVEDLLADRTTVTRFRQVPGRRRFPISDTILHAVTVGAGVVICVGAAHELWARQVLAPMKPEVVFAHQGKLAILQHLTATGVESFGPSFSYLCSRATLRPVPCPAGLRLELLVGKDIAALYRYQGLHMALSYYTEGDRPDMIAAAAWDGGDLAGVAACSADSDQLWQVGIDVLPAWRRRGVGKWLVGQVTRAILQQGKLPYYSCGLQNLASQRIACAVGYWPAWTSLASR